MPLMGKPPPFKEHVWRVGGAADLVAQGRGYTDGACRSYLRRTRRAGWGACVTDDKGQLLWGIFGTCPDAYACPLRAELWGLLGILRYAVPPLCIGVDNGEVVLGWQSGSAYCCAPGRNGADLWRRIWALLGDIGEGVTVYKVKAHLTIEDAEVGLISWCDLRGNDSADHFAVKGALLAERKAPNALGDSQLKRAMRFYRWVAGRVADWKYGPGRRRHWRGGARQRRAWNAKGGKAEAPNVPCPPILSPLLVALRSGRREGIALGLPEVREGHAAQSGPKTGDEIGVPRFGG